MQVILLGPPGGGKGTQSAFIRNKYHIPQISTGEMLRAEITAQSALGKKVKHIMARGELVSDDLVLKIIDKRLTQEDCRNGFILDGFPRTIAQADGLQDLLTKHGMPALKVISLEVPDEELLRRLMERKRADDSEKTIANRLQVYRKKTEPLIGYYRERGILHTVNGLQDIGQVSQEILDILEA